MKIYLALIAATLIASLVLLLAGLGFAAKMLAGIALTALSVVIALVGGFWIALPMMYLVFHWMWPTQFPLF